MVKINFFFRTLEINQSLAISQEVFLQEKWQNLSHNRGLCAVFTALSPSPSPSSEAAREPAIPRLSEPRGLPATAGGRIALEILQSPIHRELSSLSWFIPVPWKWQLFVITAAWGMTTIRVNNKMAKTYKRKSWRERCPEGGFGKLCHILGIWKMVCRCRAVYMPRKDLVRPAVSPLAEWRLCASRKGKLRSSYTCLPES